ncbi:GspH/FimT family pseudopilin [Paraburkholderia fungorum]|nr:GspH/FimT family pseudopilin [Paraburkholderia fungorum]
MMRISAPGNDAAAARHKTRHRARQRGFTLLEMLVVLLIAGLLLAVVGLAPTRNRNTDLTEEAQRLASMFESALDEAQVRSSPIAWQPVGGGYRFLRRAANGTWQPLADSVLGAHRWETDVTAVTIRYADGAAVQRIVFGEESIDAPVTVTLYSGAVHVRVISTGIGSFGVRRP